MLKIGFALSGAGLFCFLHAADSSPASATAAPRSGAPEKIEFSRSTSTTPRVPRPGRTDQNKELLNRFGNVPENPAGQMGPQAPITSPTTGAQFPSKAAAEKLMRDWDRQKNWLVPGAQDPERDDPFKQLEQKSDPEKVLLGDKSEGVMERFLKGENENPNAHGKSPGQGPRRLNDLDRDLGRNNNNRIDLAGKDGKKEDGDDSENPKADNAQSNGLADFDLKRWIRQQDQPNFLSNELPKASQMFRAGNFGNPAALRSPSEERAKERELDAKRAADFMQILKPRTPGSAFAGTAAGGLIDPINSPDLTRREMNPVLPQMSGSDSGGRPAFGAPPPSPASRIQDNNMFGVTGPAASSITPTVTAPLPRPEPSRNRSIVIEPPRRIL